MSYNNVNSNRIQVKNELQAYFEQQNDKEAASIVASMLALLPSSVNWDEESRKDDEKEQEKKQENISMNAAADNMLNNILLTKESEIAALKEVIVKWRNRAIEAETNARIHYLEQLKRIEIQHENELKLIESRLNKKLYEKDDIISTLNEQVDYLITCKQRYLEEEYDGTDSYVSTIEDDIHSIISSVYDREAEQRLVVVENGPNNFINNSQARTELKSENILDSIQITMRAIEQELDFHSTTADNNSSSFIITESMPYTGKRHHRRSPTYNSLTNTHYSSATLIDSEITSSQKNNKKIKKSSLFINRFRRVFSKLYKKNINNNNSTMNMKYTLSQNQLKKRPTTNSSCPMESSFVSYDNDDNSSHFPRSSTDETLGVYSTTHSSQQNDDFQKPDSVMDLMSAMNHTSVLA